MAPFKYFKWQGHRDCLPDLCNKQVSLGSVEEANKEVDICYKATDKGKRFALQFCNTQAENQGWVYAVKILPMQYVIFETLSEVLFMASWEAMELNWRTKKGKIYGG